MQSKVKKSSLSETKPRAPEPGSELSNLEYTGVFDDGFQKYHAFQRKVPGPDTDRPVSQARIMMQRHLCPDNGKGRPTGPGKVREKPIPPSDLKNPQEAVRLQRERYEQDNPIKRNMDGVRVNNTQKLILERPEGYHGYQKKAHEKVFMPVSGAAVNRKANLPPANNQSSFATVQVTGEILPGGSDPLPMSSGLMQRTGLVPKSSRTSQITAQPPVVARFVVQQEDIQNNSASAPLTVVQRPSIAEVGYSNLDLNASGPDQLLRDARTTNARESTWSTYSDASSMYLSSSQADAGQLVAPKSIDNVRYTDATHLNSQPSWSSKSVRPAKGEAILGDTEMQTSLRQLNKHDLLPREGQLDVLKQTWAAGALEGSVEPGQHQLQRRAIMPRQNDETSLVEGSWVAPGEANMHVQPRRPEATRYVEPRTQDQDAYSSVGKQVREAWSLDQVVSNTRRQDVQRQVEAKLANNPQSRNAWAGWEVEVPASLSQKQIRPNPYIEAPRTEEPSTSALTRPWQVDPEVVPTQRQAHPIVLQTRLLTQEQAAAQVTRTAAGAGLSNKMPDQLEVHRPLAVKFSTAKQDTYSSAMAASKGRMHVSQAEGQDVQVMERHAPDNVQFTEPRVLVDVQKSWALAPTSSSLSLKHNPDATRYTQPRNDSFTQAAASSAAGSQAFEGVAINNKHNPDATRYAEARTDTFAHTAAAGTSGGQSLEEVLINSKHNPDATRYAPSRSSFAMAQQVSGAAAAAAAFANVNVQETSQLAHKQTVTAPVGKTLFSSTSASTSVQARTGDIVQGDELMQAEGRFGHAAHPEAAGNTNQVPSVFLPIQNSSFQAPASVMQKAPAAMPSAPWTSQASSGEDRPAPQEYRSTVRTVGSTNSSAQTQSNARRITAPTPMPVEESGGLGFSVQPRSSTPKPRAHTPTWRAVKQSTGRARNNNM